MTTTQDVPAGKGNISWRTQLRPVSGNQPPRLHHPASSSTQQANHNAFHTSLVASPHIRIVCLHHPDHVLTLRTAAVNASSAAASTPARCLCDRPTMVSLPHNGFFERHGIADEGWVACLNAARQLYPGRRIRPVEHQGYCSWTVEVLPSGEDGRRDSFASTPREDEKAIDFTAFPDLGPPALPVGKSSDAPALIIQFRPPQYGLDTQKTHAAKEVYGNYAPATTDRGLLSHQPNCGPPAWHLRIFEMECLRGVPYSSIQPLQRTLDAEQWRMHVRLLTDLADFVGRSWREPSDLDASRCVGKVGACMVGKVRRLGDELPTKTLRAFARTVCEKMVEGALDRLPVVLCHGDLLPTNIMVDPKTGALEGLVDWAEAEWLPFGLCLYGLGHFFGYVPELDSSSSPTKGFIYHEGADELRKVFWGALEERVGVLKEKSELREAVQLAKDVGVLLWYGYAWDDGRCDRVVNEADEVEVMYLTAFVGSREECARL